MVAFRSPGAVNTGGFINAAAAVGADAASLADTTFKASPSYDTISALTARGQGVTDRAGVKFAGTLLSDQQQARVDALTIPKILQRNQQKMAGELAARSQGWLGLINKKDPVKPFQYDLSEYKNLLKSRQSDLEKEAEKIKNRKYEPLDMSNETDTNKNANTAGLSGEGSDKGWQSVLQLGEGTDLYGPDKYNVMFGGGLFSDLSKHPDRVVDGGKYKSAAAGAYQFMPNTWQRTQKALGLPDFGAESQEKARRFLMNERGVDPDSPIANKQQFAEQLALLSPEWASLPKLDGSSYYGQPVKSVDALWEAFQKGRGPINSETTSSRNFIVGNTGTSTGDHLDYRVWDKAKGDYIANPEKYSKYISTADGKTLGDFPVTSPYGMRTHPKHGDVRLHKGIDVGIPGGTELNINLPFVERKFDSEAGNMNIYQLPNENLELVLLHGA
mgnify:CR=1 FL=1